jgi:hypothetical protein
MRTVKWNAFLSGLCGFAVALGGVAASARADVTVDKGSSVLIFPKVIADGTFDTIIQIANTGNSMVALHCFYVNNFAGQCQEIDFNFFLTKQQPMHWQVSVGRPSIGVALGAFDPLPAVTALNNAGLALGHVPPVGVLPDAYQAFLGRGADFRGELKCVEVDLAFGQPWAGNHLKGEATIKSLHTNTGSLTGNPIQTGTSAGDVSKYNAVGIMAHATAPADAPLPLDGDTYDACPARLIVNHFASGQADPVAGDGSATFTELTLVPCRENFENQTVTSSTLDFVVYNEFENAFSVSTTVTCASTLELTQIPIGQGNPSLSIFGFGVLGTPVAHTEITPQIVPGHTSGVVGVAERIVGMPAGSGQSWSRAAYNLHSQGDFIPAGNPDTIYLPLNQ